MPPRILIVGCGAIGGLFAAALSSVAKVTALDTNAEHVKAIGAHGLRIIGKNPRVARIDATSDPVRAERHEVRCRHFSHQIENDRGRLSQLQPVLAGNPPLVTLQNGMGNAEVLLSDPGCNCHSRRQR